jgi:NitT/TauT family transport system permease protein
MKLFRHTGGVVEPNPVSPETARVRASILVLVQWITVILLSVGSLWGLWELLRMMLEVPIFDAPGGGPKGWITVFAALGASFLRVLGAMVIGAAWTLPAGILIGLSPRWSQRLQPIVQIAASFPSPIIFPQIVILLLLLHVPFTIGCVALMLLGSQWYVLFNVIAGAMAIPSELREAGRVYRMSTLRLWTGLYIPAVFPYLVTGLITAAGGAWNATIVAEYVFLPGNEKEFGAFGLGWLINHATADGAGNPPLLAASVVVMAVFVVLLNRVFWKRLYRLSEAKFSLNT